MELYFVRHGQSMGNLTEDYSTSAHDQLSPRGHIQAERLVGRLLALSIQAIYLSPLGRAVQTAAPYLRECGRTAEIWPELSEACWQPDRETEPPRRNASPEPMQIDEDIRPLFTFREEERGRYLVPENETYREGIERIAWSKQEILRRHGGEPGAVLVIGHGHAGSRLLEMLLDTVPDGCIDHANTGMSLVLEEPGGSFKLVFANRT